MNIHDKTLEVVKSYRIPVTAPTIQDEITPKPTYAQVHQCLNDLVRQNKLIEGRNEIGKRTFTAKRMVR